MKTNEVNFIVGQKPPNWNVLVKKFNIKWEETAVTYGNNIYSSKPISKNLTVHELVHVRQQRENVGVWWAKYIRSPEFRVQQEIEAYKAQLKYIAQCTKDRNYIAKARAAFVVLLSGEMYGNCISFAEAANRLR